MPENVPQAAARAPKLRQTRFKYSSTALAGACQETPLGITRSRPVAQPTAANPLPWDNVVAKSGCVLSENGNSNAQRAPRVNLTAMPPNKPIDAGIELRGPQ